MRLQRVTVLLLRWKCRPGDAERFLREQILPLVRDPETLARTAGFYVSRQGPDVVSLTVYARERDTDAVGAAIARRLGVPAPELGRPDDAILAGRLDWYRRVLQEVCEVALDLIQTGVTDQDRQVLRIARDPWEPMFFPHNPPGETYRSLIEPWLQRSAPYNALDRETRNEFWQRFTEWPGNPRQDSLSPAGHWLWNLVETR
jgi:hypothetical protein